MNVAIVVSDISNGAGTERAVTNLANLLNDAGFKVSLISILENKGTYYALNQGVQITYLGISALNNGLNKISFYCSLTLKLRDFVKSKEISVLIGTTHAINSILPFAVTGLSTKAIGCEHVSYKAAPFISRVLRRIVYPFLNRLVVLTNADKANYAFMRRKVFVISNSLSFVTEKPSELNNKVILTIGRLTYQKGFDLLLQSAALLKSLAPDWSLFIIGEGELKEELQKQAESLNLSGFVRFFPSTKAITDEYMRSSLYVMSSRWEGLPMVLIEALSCGVPIVSFSCPEGPAEIVQDGYNGFLVEPGNCQELADKIYMLINDFNLRLSLGKNAFESAKNYKADVILEKWILALQ